MKRAGRFLSEDPLGFTADDANLYRAFGNSYPNRTDPTGLVQAGNPLNSLFGGFSGNVVAPYNPINPALSSSNLSPGLVSLAPPLIAPQYSSPSVKEASDYFFRNSTLYSTLDARQLTFPSWQTIQEATTERMLREAARIYAAADLESNSYVHDPVLKAVDAVFGNTRVQGGLQAATGVAQIGAGLLATNIPFIGPIVGPAIGLRGVDNITAGISQLATGRPQETKTGALLANTLEYVGVSPQNARAIGAHLESSFDIVTSLAGLSGPRALRPPSVTTTIGEGTGTVAPTTLTARELRSTGSLFNRVRANKYPYNEVYVENPAGGTYRLDSYNPTTGEIVSRKFTQLSEVSERTAKQYVREAAAKYSPGTKIAKVTTNRPLAGQEVKGTLYLEVPIQTRPVPKKILDEAARQGVKIRDVNGKVYQ